MPRLRYLDDDEAHRIVAELIRRVFPGAPAFQLRGEAGRAMLSSALAQPRWRHHRTLQRKAAVLHYHLNRNHPFIDGNKRFALTAAEYFLDINGAMLLVGLTFGASCHFRPAPLVRLIIRHRGPLVCGGFA